MSSIRILPDRVANQIAAGEVIERPVAVVKELVENSIDAGATRIEIEFRNGGKSYIRIEDNGKGMSPDEASLSLERHATSKIREAADLDLVSSFGFRGEALPSIASVSKFTLRTRCKGWDHGTEILINGGKLIEKKECGMPIGTVIEVANLFNSVPARRKFLKTDPTETAHITYNCRLFAVAHPNVAFRVLENGRTVFQSPACNHLRDRIAEIWGRALADDLIPVDVTDKKRGYRLTGLTAKPGVGRSTRRELVTLVNRRPVDSRTLGYAVLDAYHGHIQKGRYPPTFLFLEIEPQAVDVNVHPAKREVRFRDDGSVRRFVLGAISETLAATRESVTTPIPAAESATDKAPKPAIAASIKADAKTPKSKSKVAVTAPIAEATTSPTKNAPVARSSTPRKAAVSSAPNTEYSTSRIEHPKAEIEHPASKASPPEWRLITRLKQRYALFEAPRGLVMLHLRHADQRVRFERICRDFKKESVTSQRLLIPHSIEFEPLAAEALKSQLELLNQQGFEIEAFGRNFYRIGAVPNWLGKDQAEDFVRDLVDMVRQRGDTQKHSKIAWQAIVKLAVEGSYQRNDVIADSSIQQLAKDLLTCETPHTSPFGKPTFSEVSWNEWTRRLGGDT